MQPNASTTLLSNISRIDDQQYSSIAILPSKTLTTCGRRTNMICQTIYYFIVVVTFISMTTIASSDQHEKAMIISSRSQRDDATAAIACIFWQQMGMSNFCRRQTRTEMMNSATIYAQETTTEQSSSSSIDTVDEVVPGRLDWCEYWRKIGDKNYQKPECRLPMTSSSLTNHQQPLHPTNYRKCHFFKPCI